MRRWIKKKIAVFLCFLLVFISLDSLNSWTCSGQNVSAASNDNEAIGINVQYHTQEEIRDYVANNLAALYDAIKYTETPGTIQPYSFGKLSEETVKSALTTLNQIRYIAGIPAQVQLSDSYNELAQATSFVNYVNKELSHYPAQPDGISDTMYKLAYSGATCSNIAYSSGKVSLIDTIESNWMKDGDVNNIT